MKKIFLAIPVLVLLSGCKSLNKTQVGTGTGVAVGAVAGGLIGKGAVGALIGAAVGGTAGYFIGKKMDKQAEEIKQAIPDAQVTRVGEGIDITFESGTLFKINSFDISDTAKTNLATIASVFVKYPDTDLVVEGHTDNTGTPEYNMELSRKRAVAVGDFLKSKGIDANRIKEKWMGQNDPKYPNDTNENRIKNRRVEITVAANDQMKKEAQEAKQ